MLIKALDHGAAGFCLGYETFVEAPADASIVGWVEGDDQFRKFHRQQRYAVRPLSGRETLDELETARFAQTWVHEDHWAAAERVLAGGRS